MDCARDWHLAVGDINLKHLYGNQFLNSFLILIRTSHNVSDCLGGALGPDIVFFHVLLSQKPL